jgi:F-type H+-transporting ATPase subunit delta
MVDYTPYAEALFELAQDSKQEIAWMSELKQVAQVITSVSELSQILAHPRVKKKEIIQTAFESELDTTVFRFLLVLNEHNELSHLDKISDAYEACYRKRHRIEIVKVTSASKLDEDQLSRLKEMLEKKLNKTLELEVQVDPSLIAGIKVQASDLVMDNTLVAKINAMKEAINR